MLFIVNHIEDDTYDFKREYIMLYRILLIANNFTKITNYRKINNYLAYNFEKKAINDLHNSFALDDGFDGFNGFDDDRFHDSVEDDEDGENGENEDSDELNPINVFDYLDGGKIPLNSKISKDTYGCINLQFFMFYNPENTSTKYNLIKSNYRKFLDDSYKIYSLNTLVLRLKLMFLIEDDKITYKDHVRPMLLNKIRIICPGENNPELIEFEQLLKFFDERNEFIMNTNDIKEYPSIIDDVEYLNKSLGLLQEKYQKILDRTWNGDAGLITLIENTMATSYIELYKLINRVGYNPEVRDVIIDTIINETTSDETEFALMMYNAIKKQKIPSKAFSNLIDRRNDNHNRSTEKFANFLIGVDKRLDNLLSNDAKHNRICDFISKQPRNIQKQIFQSFKSTDELLEFIQSNNSEQKELKQLTEKKYEIVSKNIRTFKYKADSKFDCVIIPLELFDCARLTDITFESLAIINNMHLKHMNPRALPKYYYFIYHQQLCRISVDDLANGYIDYNTLLQPNTPIETKVEIMLGNGIINNAEEYRQYLVIEKYWRLTNELLYYDDILYEDLETMCGYCYDHNYRVVSKWSGIIKKVLNIIDDYTTQYEEYFENKKRRITAEINNNIMILKHKLLSFFIEVINEKIPKNNIIAEYIETIGIYGLNNIPLKYLDLPFSIAPHLQRSIINKLIHESRAYRSHKLKYITFDGLDELGEYMEIPYIDYDFEIGCLSNDIAGYLYSKVGPLKLVRYQDPTRLSNNEREYLLNSRTYPQYVIDNYEKLLTKDYQKIINYYEEEYEALAFSIDEQFKFKDWIIRYISNLNYILGIKITSNPETYRYTISTRFEKERLLNFAQYWYKDFDQMAETCVYVKLSNFPKFINDNKTKSIKYIEYHHELGLFIRISKDPRPQKKWFEKPLWDSLVKSNKSDNSLFSMFDEMLICEYKEPMLEYFTKTCVLRTIVNHIIVNILKLNSKEYRSLFENWINQIIKEDKQLFSVICKKYFDLFCDIITNNAIKRNIKDTQLQTKSIYARTNAWARLNPRTKINKAEILLLQQTMLITEPVDWRTMIDYSENSPYDHIIINPGILDLCKDDEELNKSNYKMNIIEAFKDNLYLSTKVYNTKFDSIPFIEIINNDFTNPHYEAFSEEDVNKILDDPTELIQFDHYNNRLTRFHNMLSNRSFIEYRRLYEERHGTSPKSLLIKYSPNTNKIFFDYTLRVNELYRIDIEKDFAYKFNVYAIDEDVENFETKTIIATLIKNYLLLYAFITRDKFEKTLDIFETIHAITSKKIGRSFKLPNEMIDPGIVELNKSGITKNIFVTGQYKDAKTILNEFDNLIKPSTPLPVNKIERIALLKNTFECLIDFILKYKPKGIVKLLRKTLENIIRNLSINQSIEVYQLDLFSWNTSNIMKTIASDQNILQNIQSIIPKEVIEKHNDDTQFFKLNYLLFIFNILMTTKTRLQCIIDNVFVDLGEITEDDGLGGFEYVGLNTIKITKNISKNFAILTTPFELLLYQAIDYLHNKKELNTDNIQRLKTEEKQLKKFKDIIQRAVGFELKDEYINGLIRKYVEVITKTQTYKNGEIVNLFTSNVDKVVDGIMDSIRREIDEIDKIDISKFIHDLFDNDDTINDIEQYKICETFKKINYSIPFYIRSIESTQIDIKELKRELEIIYLTIKYAVKLNLMISSEEVIENRYYYMLLHNSSLINGLLMSRDFMNLQEKYNMTLARKVFNRIVEKGSFNLEAYSINHQLILRYVYHTKKDYLKYIPD